MRIPLPSAVACVFRFRFRGDASAPYLSCFQFIGAMSFCCNRYRSEQQENDIAARCTR
jgi:hypothetical protein